MFIYLILNKIANSVKVNSIKANSIKTNSINSINSIANSIKFSTKSKNYLISLKIFLKICIAKASFCMYFHDFLKSVYHICLLLTKNINNLTLRYFLFIFSSL